MSNSILKSRKAYVTSEEFRDSFIESLTPGVIPRSGFIKWQVIKNKTRSFQEQFDFFYQFKALEKKEYIISLSDALMSADNAFEYIKTAFELLGHTGDNYVSNEDYILFKTLSKSEKDYENMKYIAGLLYDIGLPQIDELDLEDYFLGVQVGLETHRRKNVGGAAFSEIIQAELEKLCDNLKKRGHEVVLDKEHKILYRDGKTTKTVDYCLSCKKKRIGIEVNFYTSSGSKPTEIKRSYGQINVELDNVDTLLVWITDGVGYEKMKHSLKEARDIHKNIYNFKMFRQSFLDDAESYFSSK